MTQATRHTPGEWYATPTAGHEAHGQSLIIGEGGATVALAYGVRPGDAALIAAAPAMLAALESILPHAEEEAFADSVWLKIEAARAVIAQARGEG